MNKKMLAACSIIKKNGFAPVLLFNDEKKIVIVLFKSNEQNIVYGIQIEPKLNKSQLEEPEWLYMGHLYNDNPTKHCSVGLGLYVGTKDFTDESLKKLFIESLKQDNDTGLLTDCDEAIKRYINSNGYTVLPYNDFITIE